MTQFARYDEINTSAISCIALLRSLSIPKHLLKSVWNRSSTGNSGNYLITKLLRHKAWLLLKSSESP